MFTVRPGVLLLAVGWAGSLVAAGCDVGDGGGGSTSSGGSSSSGGGSSSGGSSSGGASSSGGSSGHACETPQGRAVLLYTGAGGGGPGSDIHVEQDLRGPLQQAGLTVTVSTTIPADFAAGYGVLFLCNPLQDLSADVLEAAAALVGRGGRVVSLMDHDGWGHAQAHNALYGMLGSSLSMDVVGEPGAVALAVAAFGNVTDGVGSLAAFYSGSVTGGQAVGSADLTNPSRTMVVVAAENVGCGTVVAVADVSIFGYYAAEADNLAFLKKLGQLP